MGAAGNSSTDRELMSSSDVGRTISRIAHQIIEKTALDDPDTPGAPRVVLLGIPTRGVTLAELGDLLKGFGAHDALNLDGGGSTALVIEGPDGSPELLNRPCGLPVGVERRVANHLGVFAQKLPNSGRGRR